MEALIGLAVQLIDDQDRDDEEILLFEARIAAIELVELEEGLRLDERIWVPVTVNINEYHDMGDPCFGSHFRMTRNTFEVLVNAVAHHLRATGRLRRERRPMQDILLMVLWVLATPDSFRSVALRFGVMPSTLHYFYSYIIEALREMSPNYINWPDAASRRTIKETFEEASGFPGIVGSIDCTHVYITAPLEDAVHYRNRHHSYSINVQAIVDNNLLVRHLHVGEVGSMGDSRVFRRSPIFTELVEGRLLAPDEHIVGDGAYTVTDFLMVPYENNNNITAAQVNFNKKLSQCRVRVEHAFGRAKSKWRRLKFLYARNQAYVIDYITACFMIHNFTILNGEELWEDEALDHPINNNEVLGMPDEREDVADVPEDQHPLFEGAHGRGIEKRAFITDHILPARMY